MRQSMLSRDARRLAIGRAASRLRSSAFTLVELLVVITIIGVLVGLTLPAVNAAREAGRRAACINNQKQLGLAMLSFESSRKYFPGYANTFRPTVTDDVTNAPPVSWVVLLLPYLERRDLYDEWAMTTAGYDPYAAVDAAGNSNTFKYLATLVCPSDPPGSTSPGDTWLSYVCNRGVNGLDNRVLGVCLNQTNFVGSSTRASAGVGPITRVGVDYISAHDGVSTTLLLAESLFENPSQGQPQLFIPRIAPNNAAKWTSTGDYSGSQPSTDQDLMEADVGFDWGTFIDPANPQLSDKIQSRHPGVVNVTFCDGHTRTLRQDLDIQVFKHLMSPWGKKAAEVTGLGHPTTILDEGSF